MIERIGASSSSVRRLIRALAISAGAAVAMASSANATPLRLDYCIDANAGGGYTYTFTLTNDNNDGSWQAGQGFDWFIFGDGQGQPSPIADFVMTTSFPIGPWTSLTGSGGGHNGPTFNPVTDAYWIPASVGDSLTWSGTSLHYVPDGQMLFSSIINLPGTIGPNFEVAHRVACSGQTLGACCLFDGSCQSLGSAGCSNAGGVYHGNGSTCGATNCPLPPQGACCRADGCVVVSQAICLATGGSYHGDNSPCSGAGCAAATGYIEGTDVGDTPGTAAVVNNGSGTLQTITGSYNTFGDADMYQIQICDPANFSALVTTSAIGEIFLFDHNGMGIADRFGFNGPCQLTNQFTTSLSAGNYYVATTAFLKLPQDSSAQYIWASGNFDNVERAPDGPGAANPISMWDNGGGQVGSYTITFTGACFVGGGNTCYANCDGSTSAPILNVADFTCFLQKFASGAAYANCDNSTTNPTLNVADFTCFLQKFAAGCP